MTFNMSAKTEHAAWQVVVKEWKAAGLPDINDHRFDSLIRAVELWGENLAVLRAHDTAEFRAGVLEETQERYDQRFGARGGDDSVSGLAPA